MSPPAPQVPTPQMEGRVVRGRLITYAPLCVKYTEQVHIPRLQLPDSFI